MKASVAIYRLSLCLVAGLALLVAWLAVISLQWPVMGDAAMFHFAAAQFLQGDVPYRDFIDMNMPLIYAVHTAILGLAGSGDLAFRIFDLGASVAVGLLVVSLVRPAGSVPAILAALTVVAAHLLFGPAAAGQRDYLLLIPALAAALCAAWSVERPDRRATLLVLVGVAAGLAVLLKPTGLMLVALPFVAGRFRLVDLVLVFLGLLLVGGLAVAVLYEAGSLEYFLRDFKVYVPYYAQIGRRPVSALALSAAKDVVVGAAGLALAAFVTLRGPFPPRWRVLAALTVFGAIHFVVQAKGFFYHSYPLIAGLACLGAWGLARMPRSLAVLALAVSAGVFATRGWDAIGYARLPGNQLMPTPVTSAMQNALETRLPRGARVQMLDMSGGAFLAMTRSGMRQATPFAYWLFFTPGQEAWRQAFIADLRADPPAAILMTNSMWPLKDGFEEADSWPQLTEQLRCCYDLVEAQTVAGTENPWEASATTVSWRLYMARSVVSAVGSTTR